MKRRILTMLVLVALVTGLVSAKELTIKKVVENTNVESGDVLRVWLEIINPNDEPVDVLIVDKNVIGESGIDIECLEGQAPPGAASLDYGDLTGTEGIQAFEPGEHEIAPAEVTFRDPETGSETTVRSNSLTINVTGPAQGQMSKITTLFQCGGQRIQSTSISRSSSGQQGQQQQPPSPQDTQDRIDQVQQGMESDMQELAQQIAQEQARRQAMEQALESNEEFRQAERELSRQGYRRSESNIDPGNGEGLDGDFQYDYQRKDQQARIEGSMEDGDVSQMQAVVQDDLDRMRRAVEADPQVQDRDQKAMEQGFKPEGTDVPFPTNGTSRFNRTLRNPQTNETKSITGSVDLNETVEDVRMNPDDEERSRRILIASLLILMLLIVGWWWLRQRKAERDLERDAIDLSKPSVDWRARTREMLEEAQRSFEEDREKEAYMLVSEAVRYYFSHELSIDCECTRDDVVRELKDRGRDHVYIAECLDICSLVSFAKYRTNNEDFDHIMKHAEHVIGE
ncbi:MAG: hypothetical protein QGG26_12495 [Candidatus Undinarchaeales archaeon]|nr:hypothetical protein [Candidatus Undinarchaeales archaeon]